MKYFTKQHEWVELNGSDATVGITEHAADELGDITFVELPEERDYSKGEIISVVESVKAASDIYSPVSGSVSAVNEDLEDAPEIINDDAEGKGWICKLSGVNAADTEDLMSADEYKEFIS